MILGNRDGSDKLQFVVYFSQSLSRGNDKLKFIGHRMLCVKTLAERENKLLGSCLRENT